MPDQHAKLSASGALKWMNCPLSIEMESQFPNESGEAAKEGTKAHTLGEYKLRLALKEITKAKYHKLTESLETDKDMENHTDDYRDFVIERLNAVRAKSPKALLLLEQKLDFSQWVPEGFGTADAVIVGEGYGEIIDFKYGYIPVNPEDNPQLRLYALGLIDKYDFIYDIKEMTTTIFQPRLNDIASTVLYRDDLLQWAEKDVTPKAEAAFHSTGDCLAGKHCDKGFCRARPDCRAFTEYSNQLAVLEFQNPNLLTDFEIAEVLEQSEHLAKWAKLVSEYALNQAVNKGIKYPGYKLVEGRSNRTYKLSEEEIASVIMEHGYAEDQLYERTLKGISKMESLLSKKTFQEILGSYVIKPPGNPTLVPVEDRRPELQSAEAAAEDFADVIEK